MWQDVFCKVLLWGMREMENFHEKVCCVKKFSFPTVWRGDASSCFLQTNHSNFSAEKNLHGACNSGCRALLVSHRKGIPLTTWDERVFFRVTSCLLVVFSSNEKPWLKKDNAKNSRAATPQVGGLDVFLSLTEKPKPGSMVSFLSCLLMRQLVFKF